MTRSEITIRGAREHNLRDVSLVLPKNKLIVMTGVSGSGKSSLAFDTLYAEGQRRYIESLSTYARQFLGSMPKPDVDSITGLAPSISIQQKTAGRNPRSTVGTITEIYDYLRVLFARVGQAECHQCHRPITSQAPENIVEQILILPAGTKFQILAPLIQRQKGEFKDLFVDLLKQGYLRARVDGKFISLSESLQLDKQMKHTIDVVIDRLVAGKSTRQRVAEAVENALKLANGQLIVLQDSPEEFLSAAIQSEDDSPSQENPSEQFFATAYACTHCGISYDPPSPQLFSFNSPQGMCADCNGLGMRHDFLLDRLIPDESLSIQKGALALSGKLSKLGRWRRHLIDGVAAAIEKTLSLKPGEFLKTPWNELPQGARDLFLDGLGNQHVTYSFKHSGGVWKHGGKYTGYVRELLEEYRKAKNPMRRRQLEKYMEVVGCSTCHGSRLNAQACNYFISSQALEMTAPATARSGSSSAASQAKKQRLSLPGVCHLSVGEAFEFFEQLDLDPTSQYIAEEVLKEIRGRLGFLLRCGLDYLALDRTAPTLSGGESQRIRLAGQIGCGLVGVVYILDEPSIGLHPRDNEMLLGSLQDLRDQGNTVIVVEHDDETMKAADHIIDFGPGPGVRGGKVVHEGSLEALLANEESETGAYLSGRKQIEIRETRRAGTGTSISIKGCTHHNLHNVDVEFPLGKFICVTGVSGSGKSSLINDILWPLLNREVNLGEGAPGAHQSFDNLALVDKAIDIDQSPIGRTPRSNPATYVKLFDLIRDLYTQLPDSKTRGFKPGRFSFNVPGGRCEACEGHGSNKLEMDFLADIWVTCPVCQGRRFNKETLEVRFKGKNIAEVLDMDVQTALEHFENLPKIKNLLQTLHDVGLDYIKLGQPSPTLSGGEAQRIKLAKELGKRSTGKTVYILDEPTTGLHFVDIAHLLRVLHGFVDAGNTVIVVEHNLDVIKTADWVIDLGPEGGKGGGRIIAQGTPEMVAQCEDSYTGRFLAKVLEASGRSISQPVSLGAAATSTGKGQGTKKKRKSTADHVVEMPQKSVARTFPPETKVASPSRWQAALPLKQQDREAQTNIVIRGASQHNLQKISLDIPRDQMSVFCGPSGSGKTSLAMDTLYAEGQRRYVESLSSYARQFLGQMPKPKVEHIHGLQPSIAIEQKTVGHTPRSTVGTTTEIYDYLRVLYARLGTQHCPDCRIAVESQTTDDVIDLLMAKPEGTRLLVLAPQEVPVGQQYAKVWERLKEQGFSRVRVDGTTYRLEEVPEIDRRRKHVVEIVIDRVTIASGSRRRLADSVEAAFDQGKGVIRVAFVDDDKPENSWKVQPFSLFRACSQCGRSFETLAPHNFSFNSPLGWCESCEGMGTQQGTNLAALIGDPTRTLREGAISAWPDPRQSPAMFELLDALSRGVGLSLDTPFNQLEPAEQRLVLFGAGEEWFTVYQVAQPAAAKKSSTKAAAKSKKSSTADQSVKYRFQFKGLYPALEEASRVSYSFRQSLFDLIGEVPCSSCSGSRLREDASAVRLHGKTLQQLCELPLNKAQEFLHGLTLNKTQQKIAGDLLEEGAGRLDFLVDVGLHYLTLSRTLPTLSGGESQRIRLAGQLGRALTGVLYVLDEPTIGLHPSDNGRLLQALKKLRDLGNTVVLVEHDREVLAAADRLYDFGPGSGRLGGLVTAEGTPHEIENCDNSLTGKFLSLKEDILVPTERRVPARFGNSQAPVERAKSGAATKGKAKAHVAATTKASASKPLFWLELIGARQNNLRNVDLRIPLGALTAITGVSGSGKSSLISDTLGKAISRKLHRSSEQPGPYDELLGLDYLSKLIVVDQQPLGSTPASNPATYTGVFEHIRELFAHLPESKVRGYRPARFSFNRAGGRCETCEGNGQKLIEMHFLPDLWVECDTCHGRRYNPETLAVKFQGKNIADVLEMPISEAVKLFESFPKIRGPLAVLDAIGLGYLTLGQPAPTLSGGEAQRVKLAAELARPSTGSTLYLLDEPTTGLHFDDIRKLLKILQSLVDAGNTVVVIEHNLDVIKTCDWIVDLGPAAGSEGGYIVATGTPEDLVRIAQGEVPDDDPSKKNPQRHVSLTAQCLAPVLEASRKGAREVFDAKAALARRRDDLDLKSLGKSAKMPWEVDGRKWHLVDHLANSGRPAKWPVSLLETIFEPLEEDSGVTVVWNDRSVIEAKSKGNPSWFIHALTGDEWLLQAKFRVAKGTFDQTELAESLDLLDIDDLDELPIYNRAERVRVKAMAGGLQEVTISLAKADDVATPAFASFFKEALASYLSLGEKAEALNPEDLMPWKKLGRKWHVMRKGFLKGKVLWEPAVAEALFELMETTFPAAEVDWTQKMLVKYRLVPARADAKAGAKPRVLANIITKRTGSLDLELFAPAGTAGSKPITLGEIRDLGEDPALETNSDGEQVIKLSFVTADQVKKPTMLKLLFRVHEVLGMHQI